MIRIITVGITKPKELRIIQEEYLKRISRFHRIDFVVVRSSKHLERHVKNTLVLLDERGKLMDTKEFSKWLLDSLNYQAIDFIIGDAYGIPKELYPKAHLLLSLSPMTFSHDLVRIMLLEQIYRAFFPTFNK